LRAGDRVLAIDGHPVTKYAPPARDSIMWRIITSENPDIAIKFARNGVEQTVHATPRTPPTKWYERKSLRKIGVLPAQSSIIYAVVTNGPAALAGLQRGDEILAVNGQQIFSPQVIESLEESMTNGTVSPVTLTIQRGAEHFTKEIKPVIPNLPVGHGPSFGILAWQGITNVTLSHPDPASQLQEAGGQIFATVGAVLSRKGGIGPQQMGGPVFIIRLYSNLFLSEHGWRQVLWWSVVINVNLALLNLLPFPVLDGGHIVLAIFEALRRRPMNAKILQSLQTACAMLLIGFMLYLTFYDAGDWVRGARRTHEEPIQFAPRN
jgi:regulator of sigma E protease